MGRVRKVTGEDVMNEDQFAEWWREHHLRGEAFVDELRRRLAKQLQMKNFRQLALVCGNEMLSPESHWMDAELVVVIRPYSPDTDADGRKALARAALDGDVAGVVSLLEIPLDPDTVVRGGTPMLFAAFCGHQEVVRCLLEAGADKEKPDHAGRTPMHLAAMSGRLEVVCCLMEAGADKDKADNGGVRPMQSASCHGHLNVVRHLRLATSSLQLEVDPHPIRSDVAVEKGPGATPNTSYSRFNHVRLL